VRPTRRVAPFERRGRDDALSQAFAQEFPPDVDLISPTTSKATGGREIAFSLPTGHNAPMEPDPVSVPHPPSPELSDPEQWVELHGDYLFKYALGRLRDPVKAEDAVQETFLAALKGGHRFAGRSAEKSWLVGILKNKIYDHYRKAGRETSFTDLEFYSDEEGDRFVPEGLFQDGWIHDRGPQEWSEPGASLDSALFWRTFQECSRKLPKNIALVFHLREVDDLESREICDLLQISESNLWVMLHRARMALRRCLETNWFGKQVHPLRDKIT
jgi:RNA polymerase sigma-70 factor (ECF subfamily)